MAAVVLGRPARAVGTAGEADRRIQHDRGRGEVALQRRRIDEGFERRTRLTARLGRPVEAGQRVGVAADHRQHAAGLRLDGDQRSVDARHLLQGELSALRLHEDQFAAFQLTIGVGPGGVRRQQRAGLVVAGGADANRVATDAFDGGGLPAAALGRRLFFQRDRLPAVGEVGRTPAATPAVTTVVVFEPLHQGPARRRLQRRVQGGAHIEAAGAQLLAELGVGGGLAARLLDEEVGVLVIRPLRRIARDQRLGAGLDQLFRRQPAALLHLAQHPVTTALGRAGVTLGVIVVRSLR